MIHDASKGFRDIKAIPEFELAPFVEDWSTLIGVCILLVAIAYLTFALYSKFQQRLALRSKESILNTSLESLLSQLNANSITLRDYTSRASVEFRKYLGSSLEFNATDCTNKEVANLLDARSKRYFSDESKRALFCEQALHVLRVFESTTFRERAASIKEATSATEDARIVAEQLKVQLEDFEKREKKNG